MTTCASCGKDNEHVVWVPKLPKGALPFCANPSCQRAAKRRAALVFANHRPREPRHAPVS